MIWQFLLLLLLTINMLYIRKHFNIKCTLAKAELSTLHWSQMSIYTKIITVILWWLSNLNKCTRYFQYYLQHILFTKYLIKILLCLFLFRSSSRICNMVSIYSAMVFLTELSPLQENNLLPQKLVEAHIIQIIQFY